LINGSASETDSDSEANRAMSSVKHLGIGKSNASAGAVREPGVSVHERINATECGRRICATEVVSIVRVVECIHHAHVPGDIHSFAPFNVLGYLKVGGVRDGIGHLIAANAAKRRAEDRLRRWTVEDVPNLALGYWILGTSAGESRSAVESRPVQNGGRGQ